MLAKTAVPALAEKLIKHAFQLGGILLVEQIAGKSKPNQPDLPAHTGNRCRELPLAEVGLHFTIPTAAFCAALPAFDRKKFARSHTRLAFLQVAYA